MTYRRWWCNCRTPLCFLDSALHGLGITWRRVCDAHDRQIIGDH